MALVQSPPMTIRDEDGHVHVATDMVPADNRRADEPINRPPQPPRLLLLRS